MAEKVKASRRLFRDAQEVLVGGVNSPVRAFKAMSDEGPIFFERGQGAYLIDADGNRYLDFCLSWGPLILGHADASVVRAVTAQAKKGLSFGAPTELETRLARLVQKFYPTCEKIRFTSSGTEAVMTAIRIARGATQKKRIIKFEGCYHGHSDALLVKGGSGLATLGTPTSAGIPEEAVRHTTVLRFNDEKALGEVFKRFDDIACVILEPVAGNMGLVPATKPFVAALRHLTQKHGAVLIFDEVMTGFRVGLRGAQSFYRIKPDLTVLGKVMGGGMPVGAVGGGMQWMKVLAPEGPAYQAGTLSGNPVAMACGLATLQKIAKPGFYEHIEKNASVFEKELRSAFQKKGIEAVIPRAGTMFGIYFGPIAPKSFDEISSHHVRTYKAFFTHMLSQGFYFPPSAYEAMFLSSMHTQEALSKAVSAAASFEI